MGDHLGTPAALVPSGIRCVGFLLTESSQNHVQTRSRCHVGPVYIRTDQSHQMCTIKNPISIFRKSRPLCAGGIGKHEYSHAGKRKTIGWRRINGDSLPPGEAARISSTCTCTCSMTIRNPIQSNPTNQVFNGIPTALNQF